MSILPHSTADEHRDKAGAKVALWLVLGLVVLFGGLYVAAWAVAGDKVPRGTTVSGVSIGGHPQSEAADRLRAGMADRVTRDIAATIDGEQVSIDPDEAGLSVDYTASVAEAGGRRSWHPVRLWNYFTGGEDLRAVIEVDETAYNTYLTSLDAAHGREAVDGAVAFKGATIDTTDAVDGLGLDPSDTLQALEGAYVAESPAPVDLQMTRVVPDIDADDVQEALDSFASPAVAAPVVLDFEGTSVKVFPRDFTAALSLEPHNGVLVPTLDIDVLTEALKTTITTGAPVDATVRLVNGAPQVVPGKKGVTFDEAQLEEGFLALVAQPEGQRTLALDAKVAQPEFTTKDARALKINREVASFTTYYPHADYRNTNLGRAAQLINGAVLKPGETFSLNDTVGERTRENGFTEGFVINNGVLVEDLGGGVSQMATTLFNAMFFAGLEDVEHKPHSFYIDRYPVGREATVAWGALDLRFKNDTPYGVLVQAAVTPSTASSSGAVTVTMYSTKWWDITTKTGERHNFTQPKTRRLSGPKCHPNSGYGGFDIEVTRFFKPAGDNTETRRPEVFSTTYTPSDTVVCVPPSEADQ